MSQDDNTTDESSETKKTTLGVFDVVFSSTTVRSKARRFLPKILSSKKVNKRWRICVEIREYKMDDDPSMNSEPETIIRILLDSEFSSSGTISVKNTLHHLGSINESQDPIMEPDHVTGTENKWIEQYEFSIDTMRVEKQLKKICIITTEVHDEKKARDAEFKSEEEALRFHNLIKDQKHLQEKRRKGNRMSLSLPNISNGKEGFKEKAEDDYHLYIDVEDGNRGLEVSFPETKAEPRVQMLIEIVSAEDLPAGHSGTSHPQVSVWIGNELRHKTKTIKDDINPIWTVKTGSFFLLSMRREEFFKHHSGIQFEVKDDRKIMSDKSLGVATVPPKTLYNSKGGRMKFKLKPLPGEKDYGKGSLIIRSRLATEDDIIFMEGLVYDSDDSDVDLSGAMKKIRDGLKNKKKVVREFWKKSKLEPDGTKKMRVRPAPDPNREEETKWMSEEKIEQEALKKSQNWVEAGSGIFGKLYLEVIGCDSLPNMDTGILGNKTDARVAICYEDICVKTSVLDNLLSPRWMPWTERAFIFNIMHPSSEAFLGVFDYDTMEKDDFIGRAVIDVTNFIPKTEYILCYELFSSGQHHKRTTAGTITVRLHVEYENERDMLLTSIRPPPEILLNMNTHQDYEIARHTIGGTPDMANYSHSHIFSYLDEISSHQIFIYYIKYNIIDILLWRTKSKTCCPTYMFPTSSLALFVMGVTLVEIPSLLPSYLCLSLALIMLNNMNFQTETTTPWDRSKTFYQCLQILIFGHIQVPPQTIKPYEDAGVRTCPRMKRARFKMLKRAEKFSRITQQTIKKSKTQVVDESGKPTTFSMDPLKHQLFPIQWQLAKLCKILRFTRYVITWQESYYAFWITVALFLMASLCLVFVVIPWGLIFIWVVRSLVWTLLGPWMKLVDIFYYSKLESSDLTEGPVKIELDESVIKDISEEERIKKENEAKLSDMRKHVYGKFTTSVPILKLDRYRDIPLPKSTATPIIDGDSPLSERVIKNGSTLNNIPGQYHVAPLMIEGDYNAKDGQDAGCNDYSRLCMS